MEIETLTPRLVSTVAWFLSGYRQMERLDGLLLMLSEFYWLTVPRTMSPSCHGWTQAACNTVTTIVTVLP